MIQVVNLNEQIVEDMLAKFRAEKKDKKMCYCDACLTDIMTITLNTVEPRYVANPLTETFFKPSATKKQYEDKIRPDFNKAVKVVKKSPRH